MATYNDYRGAGFTVVSNNLLKYYPQLQLTETELVLILELEAWAQKNNTFPSNDDLAKNMTLSPIEISQFIQQLIDKDVLILQQGHDQEGRINNYYDLNPLYEKIDKLVAKQNVTSNYKGSTDYKNEPVQDPIQIIIRQFEIEFGRLLSPIERQEIAAWINIDHYQAEVIKIALREAVLAQVYNLKYVDRILLNWQRHNLTTPDQVKNFLQRS
ncbi:DNA replication protein [Lactobacillus colini]|uniref:DNA replication protein n=1 Tax=Lactobacillus colini TaxID=1819254 RepID=A0ABS4MBP0_9LACO|nr:DnaD domain protein [Lactobacillus colini]MBP2057083.1 DNA replication protein [Lactobacillus colini]